MSLPTHRTAGPSSPTYNVVVNLPCLYFANLVTTALVSWWHRWYGVDYACNVSAPGGATPGGLCHAPCHLVLGCGHHVDYEQAHALLNSNASMTGQNYNHTTASVFFDYLCPPSNTTSTGYKCKTPGRHQVVSGPLPLATLMPLP